MKITKEETIGITETFSRNENAQDELKMGLGMVGVLVSEFNAIGDQELYTKPLRVSDKSGELTIKLLQEELDELQDAYDNQNVVEQLDAMIDIFYVLMGGVLKSGLLEEFVEGFVAVHNNNMSKFPNGMCTKNEYGKIIKPAGYKAIDLGENFPHLREI